VEHNGKIPEEVASLFREIEEEYERSENTKS
jgi:hypothetical protein